MQVLQGDEIGFVGLSRVCFHGIFLTFRPETETEKEDILDLRDYFEKTQGVGILATSNREGKVDVAVFARPHVMDDGTAAFIMRDKLTHHNLEQNPHAAYMFVEEAPGWRGIRLFLTKIREERNSELLHSLSRRSESSYPGTSPEDRFLVFFSVDMVLPAIGTDMR